MAALVVPGAPVTVLADHGLTEPITEKLMAAGVSTVEKLGAMTPEQLEEIPEITPEMVESIQQAVVSYYGQFENSVEEPAGENTGAAAPEAAAEPAVVISESAEPQDQSVTIEDGEPSQTH
jgi:N utilization substance protein A